MEQRLRRWRWWTGGGSLLVVLSVCAGAAVLRERHEVHANHPDGQSTAKSSGAPVTVVHPLAGAMDRTTSQPGSVHAFEVVQLYAGVSGYLKSQNVDIGDQVKRGQVLAVVDVPELEKLVQRQKAGLDQSHARILQMKARHTSSKADADAAEAALVQAEAAAKSKAADLRFREQQLQRMKDLFATRSIEERLVDEKTQQRDVAQEAERAAKAEIATAKARVVASQAKIQAAEADVTEAEAEVEVAKAELEKVQVRLRFATIVAPFDGVINQRSSFPGDYIRAANEGAAQVPLLTVQRTDRMRVIVHIPDRDVPYTDVGDPALVEIDALPGKQFAAPIARIAHGEDSATRLMHVEIDLPNTDGRLRNGMYGRVSIVLDRSKLLSVPAACLVGKPTDGKAKLYVVRGGRAVLTPVVVGAESRGRIGIVTGVQASDEVVVNPSADLTDGTPVVASASAPSKSAH